MPIEVRPITGSLGAEIHGVDLGAVLDDASVAAIRRALLDHCVVFFRDQRFDATQHKALARRFGDIFVHPNSPPSFLTRRSSRSAGSRAMCASSGKSGTPTPP